MLETTLVSLQDITLDKMFDDDGRKALVPEFAKIMQQVLYVYSTFIMRFLESFKRSQLCESF